MWEFKATETFMICLSIKWYVFPPLIIELCPKISMVNHINAGHRPDSVNAELIFDTPPCIRGHKFFSGNLKAHASERERRRGLAPRSLLTGALPSIERTWRLRPHTHPAPIGRALSAGRRSRRSTQPQSTEHSGLARGIEGAEGGISP